MLEIDVFLGLDTVNPPIQGAPATKTDPEFAASHAGDDIIWHFHALDNQIAFVEVEFNDVNDGFFDKRGGGKINKRQAKLDAHGAGGNGAHGHILGTSPSLNAKGTKASKYTVKAYDGDPSGTGNLIAKYTMDPTVVTCDP